MWKIGGLGQKPAFPPKHIFDHNLPKIDALIVVEGSLEAYYYAEYKYNNIF